MFNEKFKILKCYCYFNILYSQSILNRYRKKVDHIEVKYNRLMYHHATDKYLVFWDGKEFKRFLKENIIDITECVGGDT